VRTVPLDIRVDAIRLGPRAVGRDARVVYVHRADKPRCVHRVRPPAELERAVLDAARANAQARCAEHLRHATCKSQLELPDVGARDGASHIEQRLAFRRFRHEHA
jgi:hypothetical protein